MQLLFHKEFECEVSEVSLRLNAVIVSLRQEMEHRLTWVAFGVSVFVFHFPLSCSTHSLTPHMLILLSINIATIVLATVTALASSKGAIMDSGTRKSIPLLLYLRLPIFLIEIVACIVATSFSFSAVPDQGQCHFTILVRITVALEWLLIIAVVIGVVMVFHVSDDDIEDGTMIARRIWSRRFRILKIGQDSVMRAAIDDVAILVASFFVDSDLVLSDIIAGLLLVYHSPTNNYSPVVMRENPVTPSWMTLQNARHYLDYATSVYGWPTFVMHNCSIAPLWRLARSLQCCGQWRSDQGKAMVVEDNCCYCNTSALILSTESRNIDLLFISFRNRLYEVPFAVLVDHAQKSVVVTIRGSCSLIDLVTDLCLDDELMSVNVDADATLREDEELDDEGEVRVHRGMLRSARIIFDTLRKHNLIEDALLMNPTYELIVCGHSLGAGVASLLTILLKQQFPFVKCFAFCPPGCVISVHGQKEMQKYVMSIVTGDDVVSRISYQALHQLRIKVFKELRACQSAKHKILIRGVFRLFVKSFWQTGGGLASSSDRDNLIRENNSPTYGSSDAVEVEDPIDLTTFASRVQLHVPGNTLFISEEDGRIVEKWIEPSCLNEIKMSASAVSDHLPINVAKMFEKALKDAPESTSSSQESSTRPHNPVRTTQPTGAVIET
ncbi:unnamed protein product [Caenorhabditis auriculariae]|uniref:sn-1-specific diacylglycerol lipase n=1 Tax=Caenorhabditis auriculariae TaxID=2777116 RepID=A0A8S1HY23_9PELO|nr:unnamed protein product [Caenorhabditis auriculariae]